MDISGILKLAGNFLFFLFKKLPILYFIIIYFYFSFLFLFLFITHFLLVVSDCQSRWQRLREKFSREKKKRELESRNGSA